MNPHLAELVQGDSRASCADDLRQRLLTDLRNHRLRFAFLSEISDQEKDPREPLLTRVEEVVHQVLLDSNVAGEQLRNISEKAGSSWRTRTVSALSSRTIEHSVIVVTVDMRSGWPA